LSTFNTDDDENGDGTEINFCLQSSMFVHGSDADIKTTFQRKNIVWTTYLLFTKQILQFRQGHSSSVLRKCERCMHTHVTHSHFTGSLSTLSVFHRSTTMKSFQCFSVVI